MHLDDINRWILTAAHCLPPGLEINAFFGISETGRYSTKIVVPPSNQYIYPEFSEKTFQHDIGGYIFPLKFNNFIYLQKKEAFL